MNANSQIEMNSRLLNELSSDNEGIRKAASANFNNWLVTYQRQDGVARRLTPPTPVTEADFVESVDSRDPQIIRGIVPKSAGARQFNFNTGTMSTGMFANKYSIFLHRAWTPKYRIDKIYLTGYNGDLLQIFKDLSLQDLLGTEDLEYMSMVNACVGGEEQKNKVNPDLGICQYVDAGTLLDRKSIAHSVKGLTLSVDNQSPATALVHRSMWWDLVTTLSADEVGDQYAANALVGNLKALEENMYGIKWITALDSKLVPMNNIYVFAPANSCGEFVTYGEAKTFSELKDDIWFEMFAHETYGMSMPYQGCVTRAEIGKDAAHDWTISAE